MKKSTIIIIVVVALLAIWGVSGYNGLVTMDENVSGQWSNVETQYQRRADLIPNLVNTVKGYASHEKETLEGVVEARSKATQMTVDANDLTPEKLAEMEKRRGESRKARAKTGMPVVSLVGYTNVGKSSLMNALCGPSVAEADMLFATLDPTSRKLILPSGMAVLLVDTVGFVSRLPHNLVEAFKSTLEEAAWSDVIIRVADAGDEQREEQLAVTDEVLDGLDCADIPRLTVYNKCDKPGAMSFDPDILLTSAKTGYGLDTLLAKLDEVLSDRVHTLKVLLPYDKLGLAAPMRERGSVQVEEYREDGLYLEGIVKTEDLHCFEGYLV